MDDVPHIDIRNVDTLPDHLFCPSGTAEQSQSGGGRGGANNQGAPVRSRFNRPVERVVDGVNLEDLTDFAVHAQYDVDQSVALLNALHEKYLPENMDGSNMRKMAYELWGLEPDMRPDLMRLEEEYRRSLFQTYQVYQSLLQNNMIGNRDNETLQNQRKITMVFEVLYLMRDHLMSEHRWRAMCDPSIDVRLPDEVQIFKFSPFDYSTCNGFQNLLIYLLQQAYIRGYRRMGDGCYEQVKTPEHHYTHAWRKVCTIREMIHKVVQKESNFEMWKSLTHSGDADKRAATYLEQHEDVEFPLLEPNRHVFAFRNGVLMLGGFKKDANSMVTEMVLPQFHPYDISVVPDNVVASKFFDLKFNYVDYFNFEDWYQIPTPSFQSILDYQQFPEEACRMMYVVLGRMMYNVGEHDNWQIMPFFRGVANSGKSTILRVAYTFYNPENVGIMTSNMEKKFWSQAIYDKFMFLCYEARSDFNIHQGEFQSVISGEEMSVPIKYKTAVSITWKVPGMMAGNEVPTWIDAAGSMQRRLLVWEFKKMVVSSDTMLLSKLRNELPALLHKCNMAYLQAINDHGEKGMKEWWPDYFKKTSEQMAAKISPLRTFIEHCDLLVRKPTYYMPMETFQLMFNTFCTNRQFKRGAFTSDMYTPVFEAYGLVETKAETLEYDGIKQTKNWVYGLGPREVWEPVVQQDGAAADSSAMQT